MPSEYCFGTVCFVPLDGNSPRFFGFSEFLASLALMVLAWTTADVRYRFRVRTAPLPLASFAFWVVATVGVLTLLTDLWRAQEWLVPQGNLLPAMWQALLGGLFLLTFLTWAWFAFIRPPTYNRINAKRYAKTLYQVILRGSPSELALIADELTRSVTSLIHYASAEVDPWKKDVKEAQVEPSTVTAYADAILQLIADKRFCRAVVDSSPGMALALFKQIEKDGSKVRLLRTFARNIVHEALINEDSFLYHETESYHSGLIGHQKPLSQAMFGNHRVVEAIGTLFDLPFSDERKAWTSTQWSAYRRLVLITLRSYVQGGGWSHLFALWNAMRNIGNSATDIYTIDGTSQGSYDQDVQKRLRGAVEFIKDAVEVLDKAEVPVHRRRLREKQGRAESVYDHLAEMIFEVIASASMVQSPEGLCWWIQHNSVWGELFNFGRLDGAAGKIVKFKVRRLIFAEITELRRPPNFPAAKLLGFCLNVMGFDIRKDKYDLDSMALHRTILSWTKQNYAWLHSQYPRLAQACLVDGITYDAASLRLVRTYPADGFRREPKYEYFNVGASGT